MIDPATVGNPHIRAHASEGKLFRSVLESALKAHGISCEVIVDKHLAVKAAAGLKRGDADIRGVVAGFGKALGGPWRADEKAAAAAAWLASLRPLCNRRDLPPAQRRFGVGFQRRPLFHQIVEALVGARADFLVGLRDLAADVRQLIDEHLVFVRAALGDEALHRLCSFAWSPRLIRSPGRRAATAAAPRRARISSRRHGRPAGNSRFPAGKRRTSRRNWGSPRPPCTSPSLAFSAGCGRNWKG